MLPSSSFKLFKSSLFLIQRCSVHQNIANINAVPKLLIARGCSTSHSTEEKTSLDKKEADKFDFAFDWWDESGDAGALHSLNKLRIPFIRDNLLLDKLHPKSKSSPLEGLKILDVGCGGGLLAEPIARLGAFVAGVDALPENIDLAEWHASLDPSLDSTLVYRHLLVEDLIESDSESFDAVICSEVLEHVNNPEDFINSCCALLKPGGSLFITSINKTPQSYALAIIAAEQIFRIVKSGSHDWNKFVPMADLQRYLQENAMTVQKIHGMTLNPFNLQWCWIEDTSVNYALHATKYS